MKTTEIQVGAQQIKAKEAKERENLFLKFCSGRKFHLIKKILIRNVRRQKKF